MGRIIVHTNPVDGGTVLTWPAPHLRAEDVIHTDCQNANDRTIIEESNLPQHFGHFFGSLEHHGNGDVRINFAKAKEQTKAKLRHDRNEAFAPLDIAFQRAIETGADTSAIVREKQRLRDITKLADKCTTLEELMTLSI